MIKDSVIMYRAQVWMLNGKLENRLQAFEMNL